MSGSDIVHLIHNEYIEPQKLGLTIMYVEPA